MSNRGLRTSPLDLQSAETGQDQLRQNVNRESKWNERAAASVVVLVRAHSIVSV